MQPVTRRRFLASTGVAAATAAVAGPIGNASAATHNAGASEVVDHEGSDATSTGVVVHVRVGAAGEVSIMSHDHEVVVSDKQRTAAIARAARRGKQD